jgi:putative membrane protein
MLYLWIKSLHLIALVSWMAAMLYLPRLFVYHADTPVGSPQSETFKVMERRLAKAIMTPAMLATWVFGLLLVWQGGWWSAGWLHAKFALVVAMSGVHGFLAASVRPLRRRREPASGALLSIPQ